MQLFESFLEEANIVDMMLDLEANALISFTREDDELFETLDSIITKCMK